MGLGTMLLSRDMLLTGAAPRPGWPGLAPLKPAGKACFYLLLVLYNTETNI